MRQLGHQVMPRQVPGQGPPHTRVPGHCFPWPAACAEPPAIFSLLMVILFGAFMGTIAASANGGHQARTLVLGAEVREPWALQQAPWYRPVCARCLAGAR